MTKQRLVKNGISHLISAFKFENPARTRSLSEFQTQPPTSVFFWAETSPLHCTAVNQTGACRPAAPPTYSGQAVTTTSRTGPVAVCAVCGLFSLDQRPAWSERRAASRNCALCALAMVEHSVHYAPGAACSRLRAVGCDRGHGRDKMCYSVA